MAGVAEVAVEAMEVVVVEDMAVVAMEEEVVVDMAVVEANNQSLKSSK